MPCRIYTLADGLPHNHVNSIIQDSRGLLWMGTAEGLARFDGVSFRTYDERDGLPHRFVTFVHEARDGTFWAGTARGLCRMLPRREGGRLFQCWSPGPERADRHVLAMYEDSRGELWLGTEGGLFRVLRGSGAADLAAFERVDPGLPPEETDRAIRSFSECPDGTFWAAGGAGLFRWRPGDGVERFTRREGLPQNQARKVLCDSRGRVWAGFWDQGLALLVPAPVPGRPVVRWTYRGRGPDLGNHVLGLFETSDGRILASVSNALNEILPPAEGRTWRVRRFGKSEGLGSDLSTEIGEDRQGNLWVASSDGGVTRILKRGFTSFGREDGIAKPDTSFLADVEGEGLVAGRAGFLHRFDGIRFHAVRLNLPAKMFDDPTRLGWGWGQSLLRDREGEWWIPTEAGIYRFGRPARLADLALAAPKAHYTVKDGLASNAVFRLFEDSRGDVWISLLATHWPVATWVRRRASFISHEILDGAGRRKTLAATAFAEDRHGQVWVGFFDGGLARCCRKGWEYFGADAGAPAGFVDVLLVDGKGRLWVGSSDGLRRVNDPGASKPEFLTYGRKHGLPSEYVTSLAEDNFGRIYVGMHSQVSMLDPEEETSDGSLRLIHYSGAEGVLNGNVKTMIRDRQGAIWTGGVNGVSRFDPEPRKRGLPAPAVRFMALKLGGVPLQISEFGERHLHGYSFSDRSGAVEVGFALPGAGSRPERRYSFLLEGSGGQWSPLSSVQAIALTGLSAGRYRLLVKAAGEDEAGEEPAVFEFSVTAPLYRRGWFLGMLGAAAGLTAYWVRWSRYKRALGLERMRMQIATDLHDELGAGLTQVALTSDVARLSGDEPSKTAALEQAAGLAREMIGSVSDLVFAISPRQDDARSLSLRMRAVATETLAAKTLGLDFEASEEAADARLDPEQRRQVLAVFREAIRNAVKHSGGTCVKVRLRREGATLVLEVADDGRGLEAARPLESECTHGIAGMRWRAQMLGGRLEIGPAGEKGLKVTLRVPLRRSLKGRAETGEEWARASPGEAESCRSPQGGAG